MKKRKPAGRKPTLVLRQLNRIERKLGTLEREEEKVEREERSIEKKEAAIQKEQQKTERILFQLGQFTFKRKHLLELIRGTAGAFLGVGIGRNLLNLEELAGRLPWWNVFGILVFVLFISGLLIYKNEKDFIARKGYGVVWQKLILLYLIAALVELIALWLFKAVPGDFSTLIKMIIIGSYAAMGGAVTFTIV
ncbi:MAG: hypothetical protein AABX13_04275 [Nanoarchaeota archaeon]